MTKRRFAAILVVTVAIMLFILPVFTGCGKVAEFSDPMTENILVSMNKADYASFSRDFDSTMKAELDEDFFTDFLAQVIGSVGNYKEGSKKMVGVNINNDLTTATYTADFENAEDITVEVTFKKIGGKMQVAGLWFK
jgi:hypothetical protein